MTNWTGKSVRKNKANRDSVDSCQLSVVSCMNKANFRCGADPEIGVPGGPFVRNKAKWQ
jgi:hypothetical protein